jgi:hypothetical protein
MTEDGFDLILFLVLDVGINVITVAVLVLIFELFKVLDVVNIIGDLGASARHADFIRGWS